MSALPFEPTRGSSRKVNARFLRANLGDGYDQRNGDGIQTIKEEWNVTFVCLDETDANTLVAFFEGLEGYQNFTWTPFRQSVAKKFICPDWTEQFPGSSNTNIQATFVQVFDQS